MRIRFFSYVSVQVLSWKGLKDYMRSVPNGHLITLFAALCSVSFYLLDSVILWTTVVSLFVKFCYFHKQFDLDRFSTQTVDKNYEYSIFTVATAEKQDTLILCIKSLHLTVKRLAFLQRNGMVILIYIESENNCPNNFHGKFNMGSFAIFFAKIHPQYTLYSIIIYYNGRCKWVV